MNRQIDMIHGSLLKNIILYTIPIILTGILQLLFNAADLVIVGRFCGSVSVAAVGATGSIINLLVNFFMGLSVGAGVSIAHAIGAGDDSEASATVHTAIPTAIICGAFLTVIGIFGARPLLELMGNPADVIGKSTIYMQIYFCGTIGNLLYNFGASVLRAAGDTKSPLIFLTIAGVVNVVLNVIFVVVFNLDVAGVALATTVSQILSAVLVVRQLANRSDCCRLYFSELKIEKRALFKMLRIGVPAGIQSSLFAISNVTIQSSINSFGSVVMSGNAAASNIEGFIFTTLSSFSQTALNFTGQNMGAKNYKRVKKIFITCISFVVVSGLALGGLAFLFSKPLLSIYITDSAEAIHYGTIRLGILGASYFLCGSMDTTTGVLRGMGRSVVPMIVTVIGVCVMRVGWVLTIFQIPQFHTLESLYISYPISWALTFIVQVSIMIAVYCKTIKQSEAK